MRSMRAAIACLLISAFIVTAAPCAMCEGFQYESHGKRDPFTPLVGGARPIVAKLEDITSAEDLKVEGIAVGARDRRVAIINGETLKENDKVGEVELLKIEKDFVTVALGGKHYNLYLKGENGGLKSEK